VKAQKNHQEDNAQLPGRDFRFFSNKGCFCSCFFPSLFWYAFVVGITGTNSGIMNDQYPQKEKAQSSEEACRKMDEPLNILLFSASLRNESLNTRLAKLAAGIIQKQGHHVDYAEMQEFDCPSFNQELEDGHEIPPGAEEFRKRLLANDAFIISSPEYNFSMPGLLKNSIDWVSRFRPQPFNERHALLMSASPSMAGGNRGLWCLRVPLEHLGARVFPNMFSLATAHKSFKEDGTLQDSSLEKRFEDNITAFLKLVEAAKHYPSVKKAWVEFLGEKTDAVTERVE
jgi:chromate reductase, NAD(P)H dehydrogenase (quinone)